MPRPRHHPRRSSSQTHYPKLLDLLSWSQDTSGIGKGCARCPRCPAARAGTRGRDIRGRRSSSSVPKTRGVALLVSPRDTMDAGCQGRHTHSEYPNTFIRCSFHSCPCDGESEDPARSPRWARAVRTCGATPHSKTGRPRFWRTTRGTFGGNYVAIKGLCGRSGTKASRSRTVSRHSRGTG